jgi:Dolichyl-phosphate-mannose-protein mannosyltransferase
VKPQEPFLEPIDWAPGLPGRKRLRLIAILALAIVELSWLAWFLIEPLPNANNSGLPTDIAVRRGWLVLKALPQVVPGTSFRESLLGNGLDELSHLENLPQRVPILLVALLIAAAAVGLGDLVLRSLRLEAGIALSERIALDFGLGAGLLGVLALLVGRLGWLDPWFVRAGLAVLAGAGLFTSRLWRAPRAKLDSSWWWKALLFCPFVVTMILASMLPSIDFDVLEYHLEGPKEYFQSGRISYLPHNVYTNMPFNVEMLHLLAMEVMGDWWWGGLSGQVLVASFGPAAAILIGGAARRLATPRAGWIAALVYLSTPWIYRLAAIAYVEGPLCFYHAALIWVLFQGRGVFTGQSMRVWGLLGLLAGCAMGCKYTGLVSAVIPFGLLSLLDAGRKRSLALVGCYLLGWAVVMSPWLGKNVIDTRNPVYPLAYRIFPSPLWDAAREVQWQAAHGPRPLEIGELTSSMADLWHGKELQPDAFRVVRQFWSSLVDVAGRSDWQSPLYFALAPLSLLRLGSRRAALALWLFVAYLFLTWWFATHRLDRFWLPMLPALAILAGSGADWIRTRTWSVILVVVMTLGLLTNLTYISTALAGLNEWTADLVFLRRDIPKRWNAAMARLDTELPPDAKPLFVGQAAVFHLGHHVACNTVFNPETIEQLAKGKTADEFRRGLEQRNLTHVYVDWKEISRHREPGGYGFSDFVVPARFTGWVAAGVLAPAKLMGPDQELYEVRPAGNPRPTGPRSLD